MWVTETYIPPKFQIFLVLFIIYLCILLCSSLYFCSPNRKTSRSKFQLLYRPQFMALSNPVPQLRTVTLNWTKKLRKLPSISTLVCMIIYYDFILRVPASFYNHQSYLNKSNIRSKYKALKIRLKRMSKLNSKSTKDAILHSLWIVKPVCLIFNCSLYVTDNTLLCQ